MGTLRSILGVVAALAVVACASTKNEPAAPNLSAGGGIVPARTLPLGKEPQVEARTILPESFAEAGVLTRGVERLHVAVDLVESAVAIRPHVQLRKGPGVDFELNDHILAKGDRVLVFELVGSWRRIVEPTKGIRGWAHRATLRFDHHDAERLKAKGTMIEVKPAFLPMEFAVRELSQLLNYETQKPLSVRIPARTGFYVLKYSGQNKLVWLPETNSVAWLRAAEIK